MKWKVINFFETTKHKCWVAWYLVKVCGVLLRRAIAHDLSKYTKFERSAFEITLFNLKNLEYNSTEYKEAIKSLGPALHHHYKNNAHHPEHWDGNIDAMSPLEQIEMLCDWKAAGKRIKGGNMAKSFNMNRERFQAAPRTFDALERAAKEIGLMRIG